MITAVLIAGVLQGMIYGLISLGLTLMFGVLRVINFAHGDLMMVAMYAAFLTSSMAGLDPLLSLVFILPAFVLCGAIYYAVLIRPSFRSPDPLLAQVFVTVGTSIVLQNLALIVMGADYQSVRPAWGGVLVLGQVRLEWSKLIIGLTALSLAAGLSTFLFRTRLGRQVRAVSENPIAAGLVGINVQSLYRWTFAGACGLVAIAGVLLSTTYLVYPTVGLHFGLLAFVVIIIGGLGSIRGALVGGLLIGLVESLTGYYVGPIFSQAFIYAMFIMVLIMRPTGLFGEQGFLEARSE